MASDRLGYKLDGELSLDQLRKVVDAFVDLVDILSSKTSPDLPLEWIAEVKGGSVELAGRGVHDTDARRHAYERTVEEYDRLGEDICSDRFDRHPPEIVRAVHLMTSMINGRIPRGRMLVGEHEWEIKKPTPDLPEIEADDVSISELEPSSPIRLQDYTRTSVRAKVANCGGDERLLIVTLVEIRTGRKIRGYPAKKYRKIFGECWINEQSLVVEGTLNRHSSKPTIFNITHVEKINEAGPGGWRQAIGCAPRHPDGTKLTSAEAVRKVRDA
ncbi:MAG: hypothetical protein WD534_06615 [Phycisphaeraceae bacterium]